KTYLFEAHGLFSLSGLSYLFLSAVKVDFEVRDSSGRRVALQKEAPIYQSPSQFKIPDTRISGWAQGTLSVKVTPTLIASGEYPIPAVYPTGIPYYVLAFDSRGGALAASDARCSAPETFALYRSPATDPVRFGATTTSRDGIGFCGGTAHAGEMRASLTHPKRNAALGSIVGWFFPFLVAIASQLYSKRRRAKLKAR
ncbi:MAG: hypothetical protein H7333_00855, partial [Bdellovibrionales bacterium]|nr:hypothetical protein [Oligoflexia bacterium]